MITDQKHLRGVLAVLVAAILWSTSGVFIKVVDWNPLAIASSRSLFALIVLVPLCKKITWKFDRNQWAVAVGYMAMMISFVAATKMTTAANAILLQYTSPIYAILFGTVLLKEKILPRDILTLAITVVGMSLFFFDDIGGGDFHGDLLAVFSGICVALVALFLRRCKEGRTEAIALGNLLVFLAGLSFWDSPGPSVEGWGILFYLGTIQIGLSFFLYGWSVPHVSTPEQVLIPMIEPLLNPLWVFLILAERPGPISLIGGVIVLSAVILRCIWDICYPVSKIKNEG